MTPSIAVVETFFELLRTEQAEDAVELLTEDVVWRNTGLPTVRGRRVGAMLRDMQRRDVGFEAITHKIAADGGTVLTERTDVLRYRRWESRFWVCGSFEVVDGRIALWDDHFAMGNFLGASLKGLAGVVRR
jgi:limonene-1,2-epoxide hydrolase